jgi:Ras-related protein Rab-24
MSKVDMKVVFLGMSDVGKTSLVERFLAGQWNPKPGTTVGAAFGAKKVEVPGYPTPITLGIWDTAGAGTFKFKVSCIGRSDTSIVRTLCWKMTFCIWTERYESMSRIYYRSARAACVCYDITNKESFRKVKFWVDELLQNEEQCAIYLVGTKLDLVTDEGKPRGIEKSDIETYAKSIGAVGVFETSAKKDLGVRELFLEIAKNWVETQKKMPTSPSLTSFPDKRQQNGSNCQC